MTLKLVRKTLLICMTMLASGLVAQIDNYKAEIGIMGGSSYYIGDGSNKLFANTQLDYGLIYRHKLNARMGLSAMWNSTKIVGSYNTKSFENSVNAIDLVGEFNFFDYEDKVYKPNSRKHSLFLFAGIGGMIFPFTSTNITSPNPDTEALNFMLSLPVGIGYKMMLGKRLNLNLIWSHKLLFNDKLEGIEELDNNMKLNGTNFINNDILSTLTIGLTVNIWKEKCDCNQSAH